MKKILFFLFLGISLNIFAQETKEPKAISLDELKSIIGQNDDKLYVINFWATWCKPCIDELPGFMAVHEQYKDNPNFKMILVSLDHKRQLNTKVKRFIDKNNIEAEVLLLDESRHASEWMPEIEKNLQDAITATLLYKNYEILFFRQFHMTQYELEDLVDDFLLLNH